MRTVTGILYGLFVIHFLAFMVLNEWRVRKTIRFLESMEQLFEGEKYHRLLSVYRNTIINKFQLLPDQRHYPILYENKKFGEFIIRSKAIFRYLIFAALSTLIIASIFDALG